MVRKLFSWQHGRLPVPAETDKTAIMAITPAERMIRALYVEDSDESSWRSTLMKPSARIRLFISLLLAIVAAASAPSGAAPASTAESDDLRAAYAGPQEVAEGKRVADK